MASQVTAAFAVPNGTPIQVSVSCDGIVAFNIFVSKLIGGQWVPQPALTPPQGATVHGTTNPVSFTLPALAPNDTALLTIPFVETSVTSGQPVSTTVAITAAGQNEGNVTTSPVTPTDGQAGKDTLFIELEA